MTIAAHIADGAGAAPWVARYEPGVDADLPASDALFSDLVASAAASAPTFPALECLGRRLSYAALHALAERVAAALARDGFAHGQRVLIALPECAERIAATLGVLRAGGVVVPVETGDGATARAASVGCAVVIARRELAGALDGASSRLVVVDPERVLPPIVRLLARVARARRRPLPPSPREAVLWPDWLRGPTLEAPPPPPDAPALEVGGVTFHHRHLVAAAAQLRAWLTDAVPGGETWLVLAPSTSALGCVAVLGSAAALRARVVVLPAWEGIDVVDALRTYQPTWVVADQAAVERLATDPVLAWADMRSVRAWLVGGVLSPDIARSFEEATGIQPCAGLTAPSAAGLLTCQPVNGRRAAGTAGLPLPGVDVAVLPGGRLALSSPTIEGDAGRGTLVVAGTLDAEGYLRIPAELS